MKVFLKDLRAIRAKHRDQTIVYVSGTFDLLHAGHLAYLRQARAYGDILVVGVNSDVRTSRVKGPKRPVINQAQRVQLVAHLKPVDYAFVMPQNPLRGLRPGLQVIRALQPDLYVTPERGWWEAKAFFDTYATKLVRLKRIDKTSTSRIIRKIKSFDSE